MLQTERVLAEEDAVRGDVMKQQQAENQMLASEQAEKERAEVEKDEALMLAEKEANKAEAVEKAPLISDPRVDIMEKSLEEIKAEQRQFKTVLEQQAKSQNETKNMLVLI
jgi:hypothetical protein